MQPTVPLLRYRRRVVLPLRTPQQRPYLPFRKAAYQLIQLKRRLPWRPKKLWLLQPLKPVRVLPKQRVQMVPGRPLQHLLVALQLAKPLPKLYRHLRKNPAKQHHPLLTVPHQAWANKPPNAFPLTEPSRQRRARPLLPLRKPPYKLMTKLLPPHKTMPFPPPKRASRLPLLRQPRQPLHGQLVTKLNNL